MWWLGPTEWLWAPCCPRKGHRPSQDTSRVPTRAASKRHHKGPISGQYCTPLCDRGLWYGKQCGQDLPSNFSEQVQHEEYWWFVWIISKRLVCLNLIQFFALAIWAYQKFRYNFFSKNHRLLFGHILGPFLCHLDWLQVNVKTQLFLFIHNVVFNPIFSRHNSYNQKSCFATGWGKDKFDGSYERIMKQVELNILEDGKCQGRIYNDWFHCSREKKEDIFCHYTFYHS